MATNLLTIDCRESQVPVSQTSRGSLMWKDFGKNILVSLKKTRLQTEASRLNLNGEALDRELSRRGFNLSRLHSAHDAHHRSLEIILSALRNRNLKYNVENARDLELEAMKGIDFVISVGGDGTFLETAHLIKTSEIPLLGINSDPACSVGKLCAAAIGKDDFDYVLSRIEHGFFSWHMRSRVGLILVKSNGETKHTHHYAVNEMLFAEKDVSRATMHQVKIDDQAFGPVQKSCGVLVCSGSGSTAWIHSASAIRVDDAELVLKATGHPYASQVAERIVNEINRDFILPPTSPDVLFFLQYVG